MFELLEEIFKLFSKSLVKKATKFFGFNKLKKLINIINSTDTLDTKIKNLISNKIFQKQQIINYLVKNNLFYKISKIANPETEKSREIFRESISDLFIRNNNGNINRDIKEYNKDNPDTPINIIATLNSTWVRAGKWIPAYSSKSDRVIGVMSIWTKNSGKEYIFPNISSESWYEITTEWTSPGGHGAGSYLWDKNLLAKSGANISRRFKLAENRFKSANNQEDQYILNKKEIKGYGVPKILTQAHRNILNRQKSGKWRKLSTTNLAYKQVNKYNIKRSK